MGPKNARLALAKVPDLCQGPEYCSKVSPQCVVRPDLDVRDSYAQGVNLAIGLHARRGHNGAPIAELGMNFAMFTDCSRNFHMEDGAKMMDYGGFVGAKQGFEARMELQGQCRQKSAVAPSGLFYMEVFRKSPDGTTQNAGDLLFCNTVQAPS
ncbi:hypothetical protein KCU77_g970, partial [Aureobasidium melanogenum]